MGLMQLRRWTDNILICDVTISFSGFRWMSTKPIHRTITGVSIPQVMSVQERWWDATFEFASDDPVNTLARYDTLAYEANNDYFFKFIDIDGTAYKCRVMAVPEVSRLDEIPDAHVIQVSVTFKQDGHIPMEVA